MAGYLPRHIRQLYADYPTRDELPEAPFEVRDAILRLAQNGGAIYRGLAVADWEATQRARAQFRVWEAWRARLVRRVAQEYVQTGHPVPRPAPEHTCVYWRTRKGVCSLCGVRCV